MSARVRIRRTGAGFVIMGLLLSTVDVNPAGEMRGAFADETQPAAVAAASPGPSASPAAVSAVSDARDVANAVAVPKAPEGGDLTHLSFTATGTLSASLVAPAEGDAAPAAAAFEVETVSGAGVELKVGDAVIPFSHIGKRTVDTKSGVTRYTYYGVALQPGPNVVTLTPLGADGRRGTAVIGHVFGAGRPTAMSIVASGPFRADGSSPNVLRIEARDAWGHHAASGTIAHVVLVRGDARIEGVAAAGGCGRRLPPRRRRFRSHRRRRARPARRSACRRSTSRWARTAPRRCGCYPD